MGRKKPPARVVWAFAFPGIFLYMRAARQAGPTRLVIGVRRGAAPPVGPQGEQQHGTQRGPRTPGRRRDTA